MNKSGNFIVQSVMLTSLILAACTSPAAPSPTPPTSQATVHETAAAWPTQGWQTAAPEETGMDSEGLGDMLEVVLEQGYNIQSISIVRDGKLVLDVYFHPFTQDLKHIIHSCTKSITSALIGLTIQQGLIESVDQPILDFFPDIQPNEAQAKAAIRLKDLLSMSSGLDCRDSYLYNWQGLDEMRASDDWVEHMLNLPVAHPPGTKFEYCNGGSYLLAAIVQQVSGMTALEFARRNLFQPLGITEVEWPASPQGINIGWGEMRLKPLDMAKFGYLYLNQGGWEGEQILPAEWVRASTSPQIAAGTLSDDYGYQWWVDENGYVMALGYAGQMIFVLPEQDMVVVFTSGLSQQDFFIPETLLNEYILPSAVSDEPLPPNQAAAEPLKSLINTAEEPGESRQIPAMPGTAGEISGRTFLFEGDSAFQEFSLTFLQDKAQFHLTWSKTIDVDVGLDGVYRVTDSAGYTRAYKGSWLDERTFYIEYQVVGYSENGSWQISFDGDQARAIYRENTTGASVILRAHMTGSDQAGFPGVPVAGI